MAKLEKSVTIKAPVEKVFDFMDNPKNLVGIMPSMVEVKDARPLPAGGYKFNWTYKMAGMHLKGASEATGWIKNRRNVTESRKGIQSKFTWTYKPEAGGTKLTVEVEYTVPVPLLGKLAEAIIIKQNEHEADETLANLKARMEA
jgi:carbon monoxide dehydrogenase subunit G